MTYIVDRPDGMQKPMEMCGRVVIHRVWVPGLPQLHARFQRRTWWNVMMIAYFQGGVVNVPEKRKEYTIQT
jgi:hypothetical protein